jgi:hypothetical protein
MLIHIHIRIQSLPSEQRGKETGQQKQNPKLNRRRRKRKRERRERER